MRYIIGLVFLALSFAAQAGHHRGHAVGFLDQVDLHNGQFQKWVTLYANSCRFSAEDQTSIDVLFRYSGFLTDGVAAERAILQDPNGDLDDVRRRINQPNHERPNSSVTIVSGLLHRARMLIPSCPAGNAYLRNAIFRITLMWINIDRAAWHVNDAIREEVYKDPEFICSGPGNHC